jgi:bidirectional [NiFe] hydrogenase diaphorase subunit
MTGVNITVDGKSLRVEHRSPILAAIRSLGINVPTLCHMDGMEPYAVCRLCIVEVTQGGRTRLVTSCNFPAEEGLEVVTGSERVQRHRRMMAELLLARCPDVERVRKLAASLGVQTSRFKSIEPSDCVLCGLCVRVCEEYVGAAALGFVGRGSQRVVGTPWSLDPDSCIACGACTYVCPTGAIHMEAETTERWRRELPSDQRLCRYARIGLVSHKVCPNDFRCSECEVDQRFFEELGTHPLLAIAPGLRRRPKQVGRFAVVDDRFFSAGHAWVKSLGARVRVGVDDFARQLVGSVTGLTLHAERGAEVKAGEPAATVMNDEYEVTLRFPVSGTVAHLNEAVRSEPALLNDDPYDRGWLYMLDPLDFYTEARGLVARDQALAWMQKQSDRLSQLLKDKGIGAFSDDGALAPDFAKTMGREQLASLEAELLVGAGSSE